MCKIIRDHGRCIVVLGIRWKGDITPLRGLIIDELIAPPEVIRRNLNDLKPFLRICTRSYA